MRTSESKTIINQELFDVKLPDYQRIIERLVSKYNVVDGSYYEGLVNFKTNLVVPKHKWYDYKQGYSELLVKHIIDEAKPLKEHYILDPFCGVGTTNLTSVNRGYKTIGFDINPMAILTAKAKTHHYTPKEIALIKKYLESFTLPDSKVEIEGGRVIETSFTEDVLDILLKIRFFVDGINNDAVQDFFRLALISIIDKCSLKIKDGNGLKFKKNYKAVPDLVRLYLDKASEMLSDIRMSNEDKENKIILGSMITEEAFNKVKDMPIGLCVFSPPYANCFDYCEVYKLEFWIGGFVKSYDDFERFRSIALRSHVNSKFSHEFSNSNKDVDTIASLISSFNIWNKNIPDMIRGYFDDMESMIKNLSKILVNKAKCYIVVANSGYKGILVPTDLLLAEIAEKYGYKVCNIYHARKIRSSSQQMHILNTNYNNLMRESHFVMNCLDFYSVKLCTYPIVINNHSLKVAIKYNSKATLLSAYIPSIEEPDLENGMKSELVILRTKCSFVCITNAYNYSLDKYGQEIYGVSELIAFFSERPSWGLVISDPSGTYKKKNYLLPKNILILDSPHSFQKVFDYADCFIRYTSTDGDSLSIHEALDFGLSVVATDVVDRPHGVYTVKRNDMDELFIVLKNLSKLKNERKHVMLNLKGLALIQFYDKIIAELK